MNLSLDPTTRQAQLTAIKTYVEANHQVNGVGVYDQSTADAMNAVKSPGVFVFVTSVSVDDVRKSLDWDEVLHETSGLTQIQQFGFNTLFSNGDYDPSLESSRDALVKIFPVGMSNTRAAVLADATRLATIAEDLLAADGTGPGGGNGTAAAQSRVMGEGAEGPITVAILQEAEANG